MDWTVAEARRRFAELLDRAQRSPQPIYRRGELIGAVVAPEQLKTVEAKMRAEQRESVPQSLARLREICVEESYTFRAPKRRNRRVVRVGR